MQVNIEVCYGVSFENSPQWMIKAEDVKTVDNVVFVKVRPYDPQFCKFLAHGFLELPKRCRPSLAQCPGWKALLKCRNDKALEQTANPDQEASLFGSDQKQTTKKLVRNAAQLQELRDNPEVMEFTVPGVEGSPDLNVSTIKPAHPCDDLYLPLDGDSIQHVVLFLREVGVDLDNLLSKRQYGGMDMGGVWRNGGASIVKKPDANSEESEGEGEPKVKRKLQRLNRKVVAALQDESPESNGSPEGQQGQPSEAQPIADA